MNLQNLSLALLLAVFTLTSCGDEKSLQRYFVEKQDDTAFLKVDIASSLLKTTESYTKEETEILNSFEKMNVLAYPIKNGDTVVYLSEKEKISGILSQEKYKTLVKAGSSGKGATLKYLGEEDAIDEIIIFASDDEKGFAVLRVLGDDIQPANMMQLFNLIGKDGMPGLDGISEIFAQ